MNLICSYCRYQPIHSFHHLCYLNNLPTVVLKGNGNVYRRFKCINKFEIRKPVETFLSHIESVDKTTYLSLEEFLSPKDDS